MTSDASQESLFLCIASPYIPSSLLPPPQCSTGPSSSLFSIFLPLYYSLHAHLYFYPPFYPSLTVLASHILEPVAQRLPLKSHLSLFISSQCPIVFQNSSESPSFYQPCVSSTASSWILSSFQANLPLLFPSLSVLTLFHLTWLFIHWCSDAKVMNSQQNAVCFNWWTLETLQEATCGGGRNSLIFFSLYAAYLDECQWRLSVFTSVIVLTSLLEWKASTARPRAGNCMM